MQAGKPTPLITHLLAQPLTVLMSAAALCASLCICALAHQPPKAASISNSLATTGTGRLDQVSAVYAASYITAAADAAAAAVGASAGITRGCWGCCCCSPGAAAAAVVKLLLLAAAAAVTFLRACIGTALRICL